MILSRAALLLLLSLAAARADECDALASRIAAATGTRIAHREGPGVDFRGPGGLSLDVTCRADPIVAARSSERSPSAAYFEAIARAAALAIGESPERLSAAFRSAYGEAQGRPNGGVVRENGWQASCYVDPRGSVRTLCSAGRIPRE
ncbi:conserved hypothetical protein [Methylobacterium sp. 4-46]|uniref:hypothetical protein n=1 Tax=unclassified Methylobacterium TaxID=2615210 RepID=UPI000152D600|nr:MULTISPECIES: hypothetical protein [Methylobacterium]ACA20906.1 conserved hypothetical protein [Methylobacterium sp. 4-46]WFT80058.1 hypothetical protein QA634_33590 [Methylobacterium nodulans]